MFGGGGGGEKDEGALKARWSKCGFLSKLPMSQSTGEKWQKRFFVAKDGYLIYYMSGSLTQTFFDTKPKGIIPLGGCKVEPTARGPSKGKFGLKITHPDFMAGKVLILASESEEDQRSWERALTDCSRVTLENAMLGDAHIEKLRTEGADGGGGAVSQEAAARLKQLQDEAMRMKLESEEKIRLLDQSGSLLEQAKTADDKIKEMERRSRELEERAAAMQAEIAQRSAALQSANAELAALADSEAGSSSSSGSGADASAATGNPPPRPVPGALGASVGMEARARLLEAEKQRLEKEKLALERSVSDMRLSLTSSEAGRKRLEAQLSGLGKEEGELTKERALRMEAEKRLAEAESRMKRLSSALERSGTKLDVEIFQDVRALMSFFEERSAEASRDAKKIEVMRKALDAKKRYLLARGGGSALDQDLPVEAFVEEVLAEEAAAREKDKPKAGGGLKAMFGGLFGGGGAKKAAKGGEEDSGGEEGSDDEAVGAGGSSSSSSSSSSSAPPPPPMQPPPPPPPPPPAGSSSSSAPPPPPKAPESGFDSKDDKGPLPQGWIVQWDASGDRWYSNATKNQTSWVRPNEDGTVPA